MQSKILLLGALLSTAVTAISSTSPDMFNSASPAQVSQIMNDIGNYFTSLGNDPAFTSVEAVLATGLPSSIIDLLANDPAGFGAAATDPAVIAAFTRLPTDVQAYLSSVGAVEVSIVASDLSATGLATGTAGTVTGTGTGITGMVTAMATATTGGASGSGTMVTSTRAAVLGSAATGSATGSGVVASASTTPATTSSKAAAATNVAVKAAGLIAAAGAVGIALL